MNSIWHLNLIAGNFVALIENKNLQTNPIPQKTSMDYLPAPKLHVDPVIPSKQILQTNPIFGIRGNAGVSPAHQKKETSFQKKRQTKPMWINEKRASSYIIDTYWCVAAVDG